MGKAVTLPCLSLIDPYARLVVGGIKTIETRTGPVLSRFEGPLLISVSKKTPLPFDASAWGVQVPLFPGDGLGSLAGCAIGVVWVEQTYGPWERPLTDPEVLRQAALHPIGGRWLSILTHAAWLPSPLPVRGFPGRFPVTVPVSVLPSWALEGVSRG